MNNLTSHADTLVEKHATWSEHAQMYFSTHSTADDDNYLQSQQQMLPLIQAAGWRMENITRYTSYDSGIRYIIHLYKSQIAK